MATRTSTADKLAHIRQLAKQWGKIIVRHEFGDAGPGLDVDLTTLEDLAVAAAQGLTAGALEEATLQQADRLDESHLCPACQKFCPLVVAEPRTMQVRGGAFELREPKGYCPACRRDFFPSASGVED